MEVKIISCNAYTKKELNKVRCDLTKVIYSDVNNYSFEDFGLIPKIHVIALLKQLKEFRLKCQYDYPKFVLYSSISQFKKCFDLLVTGNTLIEVEKYYFTILVNEDLNKKTSKVKVR